MTRPNAKRDLTLKAAAAWYGVSERTLRRRIAEGRLPAYRVGPRSIRVSAEDVAALAKRIPSA
ncbi:MAG: helix-turn-helix domain-containing protein [Actinomycetota bacterium]|jgi:excisionase family DNA binding protein|nr:helix-turn-helix domain-containing protein [Actinomycetota bacterium]